MTRQQQFDHWCKAFGYDPSRDSRGAFYNHTARLLWEAYLRGARDENDRCTEACFEYAKTLEAAGHRLALELECLLLDCKDNAVVSRWMDTACEALEAWQKLFPYEGPRLGD